MESKMLQTAWGEWVRHREWTHMVTLTTRQGFSRERLRKAFQEEWIRYATKAGQGPVPYFFAIEGGALGDRAHLHALVAGTAKLGCRRLVKAWRHGRAQVEVYDPRRAGAFYVGKAIGTGALDYDVSKRFPPLSESRPTISVDEIFEKRCVKQEVTINPRNGVQD